MVAAASVNSQLRRVGFKARLFCRSEIKALRQVLQPGESMLQCIHGYYQGGSGLLVVTDNRVLLIDKRPFFLNLEEMTYDSPITAAMDRSLLQATILLKSGRKQLKFRSISDARLKHVVELIDLFSIKHSPAIEVVEANLFLKKQYQNPAWRPRHTTVLNRPRATKYTSAS